MLLALLVLLVVTVVLALPAVARGVSGLRRRLARRRAERRSHATLELPDPGRERRAEQRARQLLRSCVNEEEWAMYRDLGFIRVWGTQSRRAGRSEEREERAEPAYAYLIYPHRPIVAFVPETGQLLSEYCVEFPDLTTAVSHARLPGSDDVLAKWMALTGDERRVVASANLHLPGRQLDPGRVRRDIWRLRSWERERHGGGRIASHG